MLHLTARIPSLRIAFASSPACEIDTGVPVLAGDPVEALFGVSQPAGRVGPVSLFESTDWLLGVASLPSTGSDLETVTSQIYQSIFEATRGGNLARIWNYVPAINDRGPSGLENYGLFCRGRSLAFERHHGAAFKAVLPAASAVGSRSPSLTVAFAASRSELRHLENPLQIPAYEYPREYGPRAPCFARATLVAGAKKPTVFISGTAAIRGHASMAPGDTLQQLGYTLENLRALSAACGLGCNLGADLQSSRNFKVYLRNPDDHAAVAAVLDEQFFQAGDSVCYLNADICRPTLSVEIEATLV